MIIFDFKTKTHARSNLRVAATTRASVIIELWMEVIIIKL